MLLGATKREKETITGLQLRMGPIIKNNSSGLSSRIQRLRNALYGQP